MIFSNLRSDKSENSQEEWVRRWKEAFSQMNDTDDKNAIWELNSSTPKGSAGLSQTMIYTDQQAKALADAAVEKAAAEALNTCHKELDEAEKERLWKAVLESCSG